MTLHIDAAAALAQRAAGALVLDVRSAKGRAENGELPGAVIVAKEAVAPLFAGALRDLPKDTGVLVFCGSVKGSTPAVEALRALGFAQAVDVEGGFAALREAGWS